MLFVSNNDGDDADSEGEINSVNVASPSQKKRLRKSKGKQKAPQGNWKEYSQKDPVPPRRRFSPRRELGFQLPSTLDLSAFNLFSLFLSQATIQTIVQNTNEYAAQIAAKWKSFKWVPLTSHDFLSFISLIIFMGLVDLPALSDYWSSDGFFGQNFIKNSGMSRGRFQDILQAEGCTEGVTL